MVAHSSAASVQMPGYVEALPAFAMQNKALYAMFLATLLTHPLEKVAFTHMFTTTVAEVATAGSAVPRRKIVMLLTLFAAIKLIHTGIGALDARLIPRFLDFARSRLMADVLDSYETKFSDVMAGDLLSKIIKLPEALRDMFYLLHHGVAVDLVVHTSTAAYFYWMHPQLGHVFVAGMVAWVVVNVGFWTTCAEGAVRKEALQDGLHEEIGDVLQNLLSVYVSNRRDDELVRIDAAQAEYSSQLSSSMVCGVRFRAAYAAMVVALFGALVIVAMRLVIAGKITPAMFAATFTVGLTAVGRLTGGFVSIRNLQHELGVVRAVEKYLDEARARKPRAASADASGSAVGRAPDAGEIRFEGVRFGKGDREILRGVTVAVRAGATTAIVGRVGCGKSTLVNILLRLDEPDAGRVTFGGEDIERRPLREWRRTFAYVPQQPKLRNLSLIDNVRYGGATGATSSDVDALLRKAGLDHVADSFRPRYNELVGVGGKNLSGGQRQIVWLLRALLSDAPVVVMDEPTSALDPESRGDVVRMLASSFKGRTLLLVTHDAEVRAMADSVIKMDAGRVVPSARRRAVW